MSSLVSLWNVIATQTHFPPGQKLGVNYVFVGNATSWSIQGDCNNDIALCCEAYSI